MNYLLPTILHHANRDPGWSTKSAFYKIKNHILKQYGTVIGYDLQFIEGKKCWSCGGTGTWESWDGFHRDCCWHCHNGWYKRPMWVILQRIQFGAYTFHNPTERLYDKPDTPVTITGYVEHEHSDLNRICLTYIFLLFGDYEKAEIAFWGNKMFGFRMPNLREYMDQVEFVKKKAEMRLDDRFEEITNDFSQRMNKMTEDHCCMILLNSHYRLDLPTREEAMELLVRTGKLVFK